jgi:ribose transport system substrate-binding protein
MGYLSVKTLVAHLHGEAVERRIDTGVRLITRDIMNQPEIQQLLKPDLSQ